MTKVINQDILFDEKVIYRFLSKLELSENGCINWTDSTDQNGYGRISVGGRKGEQVTASRWALQFVLGGIVLPSDINVCHKCDNTTCVSPEHLFPGTHRDNMDDMVSKGRAAISFGGAKLNWDNIDDIRTSNLNGVQLGEKYGVARSTISEIRNHLIWKEEHRDKAILKK
jgi:hypothetical protein